LRDEELFVHLQHHINKYNLLTTLFIMNTKVFMHAIVATAMLATATTFTACLNSHADNGAAAKVESVELIRTSQSWDGVELPDYFQGRPELVAVKYVFPPGQKLGWHHHVAMNYGVLTQGELTIIGQDGKTKVVHEGEAVVEMVGTIHHGENRGTKPVILYMFYLSQKDLPLAVQHPDIPLE
jgi:quercetin dioxygenase-like cupin family protein